MSCESSSSIPLTFFSLFLELLLFSISFGVLVFGLSVRINFKSILIVLFCFQNQNRLMCLDMKTETFVEDDKTFCYLRHVKMDLGPN